MHRALVCALTLLLISCGGDGDQPSTEARETTSTVAKDSADYQLASIDAGRRVEADHASIPAYTAVLDELDGQCDNDRKALADMAVTAQGIIEREAGRRVLNSVILESVNLGIPANRPAGDCAEFFAAYATVESAR